MKERSNNKEKFNNSYNSFKQIKSVTALQLRESFDDGKSTLKKDKIRRWVFFAVKFIIITVITFVLLYLLNMLGIIVLGSDLINYYAIILALMLLLTCLSCTNGLAKTLYYAEDNKLLITFPISSSGLFISKLIVFYIGETRKAIELLLPLTLGFLISSVANSISFFPVIIWGVLPLFFGFTIVVLLSALLSVPYFYILRFIRKYPLIELLTIATLTIGAIVLIVLLIGLIPENLDLIGKWAYYQSEIQTFIRNIAFNLGPVRYLTTCIFGSATTSLFRVIDFTSVIILLSSIGICALLMVIVYFAIKPFYLSMMTKSFEFEKNVLDKDKPNKVHKRYITFANKELKLSFRDIEISGSYMIIYIIVPILLYLLDTLFAAMTSKLSGDIISYAFNFLLILVPLLASNSMVASMFSKEGRAAYIKKTKPINPLLPLVSKLLFNIVLSAPSIIACAVVFGNFAHFNVGYIILITLIILLIHYGHIFYSATLDIMNPQNEKIATGDTFTNPNETYSTVVAFIIAFLFSILSYLFFREALNDFDGNYTIAFIKLLLIALAICVSFVLLFVLKIKAYYYSEK